MLGYYKMSIIGTAHQAKKDGVCQDASDVIVLKNGWVAAVIADGLGSAKKSEVGAATAVKTVLSFVDENYPDQWHDESLISLLRTAYHKALKTIKALAETNQDELCDYDTTLTAVIYNGVNAVFGHVGDGGIIALSSYGDYSVLTKAQKGEAFNETVPLRAGPKYWSFGNAKEDVCSLLMMTDGIFDIAYPWPLAKTSQPIYINYVRPFMDINVLKVSTQADFEIVQTEIEDFFKGPDSRQITDDKTIVGIINTDVVPELKPDEFYKEPDWKRMKKEHDDKLYGCESSEEEETSLTQDAEIQPDCNQPGDDGQTEESTDKSKDTDFTDSSEEKVEAINETDLIRMIQSRKRADNKKAQKKKGIFGKIKLLWEKFQRNKSRDASSSKVVR